MQGLKIELLGIATILMGIAFTANKIFGYALGATDFLITLIGFIKKGD